MAVGLFGKLPAHGDFVQRNLPERVVERWYSWLRLVIFTCREQFGIQWPRFYLNSPVWHFCIAEGLLEGTAWVGLIVPSRDRVGREFPLLISRPMMCNSATPAALYRQLDWCQHAEQVALTAIREETPVQLLLDALLAMEPIEQDSNSASLLRTPSLPGGVSVWRSQHLRWIRSHGLPHADQTAKFLARYHCQNLDYRTKESKSSGCR